ncbi:MAG: glycosyltransferase family 2 protein [Bacteroidetes bacterium]|nr:glycosyltransferase family 2 protein [Bacteroidota bacterium]
MNVGVIIPVFNREFELKRAITSVLKQTVQDFEVLVVDDNSKSISVQYV